MLLLCIFRCHGVCSICNIFDVCLQAALCALLGSGASYAYLVLLQQQVDSVSPTDAVPIWEAEDNVQGFARPFAIAIAAYRQVNWACSITVMHCMSCLCILKAETLNAVYIHRQSIYGSHAESST